MEAPATHSLRRLPLGLAVPGAVVAYFVPEQFTSLLWLLALLPVGLMAMVLSLVFLPALFSPRDFLGSLLGDSRAPRLTALLLATGCVLTTAWFLGGAATLGLGDKTSGIPGLVLVALARLTFPFGPFGLPRFVSR